MNCPSCCNTLLVSETVENVTIDRCLTCHGIWLDALELEKLLQLRPKDLLQDDSSFSSIAGTDPRRKCPACGDAAPLIKLNSLRRPGTILDSCTVCYGTWLDAGELSRLAGSGLTSKLRSFFS